MSNPQVYFVLNEQTGLIKIGTTRITVEARVKQLEAQYKTPLKFLGRISGGYDVETEMHHMFKPFRQGDTEWFDSVIEIYEFIQDCTTHSLNDRPIPYRRLHRTYKRRVNHAG